MCLKRKQVIEITNGRQRKYNKINLIRFRNKKTKIKN